MLSLFWCKNNNNEHRHNQHLNDHAIHTTTPTITPFTPRRHLQQLHHHHLRHSPLNAHRTVTISAGRVEGAGWQQQGRGKASPARISPARISRLKLPPEFLPRESSSGLSSYWVRRGRGGASSPDWWIRGVTWPGRRNAPIRDLSGNAAKGGGARNGAGRKAERRAEPRTTKGSYVADAF